MENKEVICNEFGNKHNFYYDANNRTVICTTYYKGKTVKGTAKCDPEDHFEENVGKKLAFLRCKQKTSKRKLASAIAAFKEADDAVAKAELRRKKAIAFLADATSANTEAERELAKLELELQMV